MEPKEYFKLRTQLIEESIDEDGVFSKDVFLTNILPDLVETKLLDSEDYTSSYFKTEVDGKVLRVNGYTINETGERLQIFILNEEATSLKRTENELVIKLKEVYQGVFNEGIRFVKSAVKRHLELQDSDPASFLVHNLASSSFMKNIDVIEVFVISPTLTVEARGKSMTTKQLQFVDENFTVNYIDQGEKRTKDILVDKKLIDLNYLYDISISNGAKYALKVDFEEYFDKKIEVLKAADEENFESYLCVLPAEGLANLYRKNSSRLLEKNVRSFLNFRVEANSEMRKTIRTEPEKFIAYNNGLTITATDKNLIEENGRYYLKSLTDFQIVNGGQTTASIFFSKRDMLDVSKINLMAKINVAKDLSEENLNELISNISLYSNTQSKVSKVDLKSRNPQIDKIKTISLGVTTPLGNKWFFEKSRGEFSTMVKLSGNKKSIEKKYPRQRRLNKVELGKYYTAWGNQPWLVKKGGEKVFRYFIEKISGDGEKLKPLDINREFYEELIAKAILFRELEILHGTRTKAIGQLRSAVVPYALSVLYKMFGGTEKRNAHFNLEKIWIDQKLETILLDFMKELMVLLYGLIRKYADSDDLGENTKKLVLWEKISKSQEIKDFINTTDAKIILKSFTSTKKDKKPYKEVDFSHVSDTIEIISNGKKFYSDLYEKLISTDKDIDFKPKTFLSCLDLMYPSVGTPKELSEHRLTYLKDLLNEIREKAPELYDNVDIQTNDNLLKISFDHIVKTYNNAIINKEDIQSVFEKEAEIAKIKGAKGYSNYRQIGAKLKKGDTITLIDVYNISLIKKKLKIATNQDLDDVVLFNEDNEELAQTIKKPSHFYYKLVCRQDIVRTPSISKIAVNNIFKQNIESGESVSVCFYYNNTKYKVEISKRKTRNEYRFFINKLKTQLKYQIDDILVFEIKDEKVELSILSRDKNKVDSSDYIVAFKKLNGKTHFYK